MKTNFKERLYLILLKGIMGSGLFTVAFLIEFDGVSDKKKYLYYGS